MMQEYLLARRMDQGLLHSIAVRPGSLENHCAILSGLHKPTLRALTAVHCDVLPRKCQGRYAFC